MIDANHYNISVRKGVFEGEECFEARIVEFPDIAEYGDSAEEAYELALDSIETSVAYFLENGMASPQPYVPAEDYSGRVTLRIARSLHRALASAADVEGVSLNQHLVNVLTYFSGYAAAQSKDHGSDWTEVLAPQRKQSHLRLVKSISMPAADGWR